MEFGVFDQFDRTGQSLSDFYEDRLKIAEAHDRAGATNACARSSCSPMK